MQLHPGYVYTLIFKLQQYHLTITVATEGHLVKCVTQRQAKID